MGRIADCQPLAADFSEFPVGIFHSLAEEGWIVSYSIRYGPDGRAVRKSGEHIRWSVIAAAALLVISAGVRFGLARGKAQTPSQLRRELAVWCRTVLDEARD